MTDLKLVPTDDLIDELMARSGNLAMVYIKIEEANKSMITTNWDCKTSWHALLGMVQILRIDLEAARLKGER